MPETMLNDVISDVCDRQESYVSIKSLVKCPCGHPRRVHARRQVGEPVNPRAGGQPKYVYLQCLGVTDAGPMSCDCPRFGE